MENSKLTTIKHDGVTYWRVADMSKLACKNLDNAIKQTQAEVVYLGDEFGNRPMRCMDEQNFMMVARYLKRRNADESHAKRIEIEIARSKQQDAVPVVQPIVEPVVDTMGEDCEPDTVYSEIKLRKFGTIKTMTEFGHTWYCGIDVAKALGYENPRGAVNAYGNVRDDNCLRHVPGKNGRMQMVEYIDEDGVYCLIHHSKRPDAKEFQDWIFSFKKSESECESFNDGVVEESDSADDSDKSDVSEIVSQTFGKVRMIFEEGKVLFCGNDVARALGYSNTRDALSRHCKPEGVVKRDGVSETVNQYGKKTMQTNEMSYITEGNVYRLIVHSKLPSAEQFEHWVFDEVLPTMRQTGGYISDADKMADTYLDGYDDETKAALYVLLRSLKKSQDANIKLQREVDVLTKQTRTYEPRAVVNALVRSFAFYCLDSDFKKAFHLFYKELYYKKRIALNMRLGTGSLINRVRDDEWNDVVEVAVAMCKDHGIDIERAINPVNAGLVAAV